MYITKGEALHKAILIINGQEFILHYFRPATLGEWLNEIFTGLEIKSEAFVQLHIY